MKIAITKEMKQLLTVAEMPAVRRIIKDMKEDESLKWYAELAASVATGANNAEILKVNAKISKNFRVRDAYHKDSADLDVWISFTAYTGSSFVVGGAYLTDIWQLTRDNKEKIKNHMYIRLFREAK